MTEEDDLREERKAEATLTDEDWALLTRCEDLRPFIDQILVERMRIAYDIGRTQGVVDATRKWGPQGDSKDAQERRLVWMVMTPATEPPLYGEGSS